MQILKDTTRQRILAIAHKEFINNGVRNTSIRTIASKAGIAVGNVYNYFERQTVLRGDATTHQCSRCTYLVA